MEKRAERNETERTNLAFAKQMIKDSDVALVLEAREREVPTSFNYFYANLPLMTIKMLGQLGFPIAFALQ